MFCSAAANEVAEFEYFVVKVRPVVFPGGAGGVFLRCNSSFASLHPL
jgi:hypothetical protein